MSTRKGRARQVVSTKGLSCGRCGKSAHCGAICKRPESPFLNCSTSLESACYEEEMMRFKKKSYDFFGSSASPKIHPLGECGLERLVIIFLCRRALMKC